MLNTAIVTVSLFSLLLFVIMGLPTCDLGNFQPFAPSGLSGFLQSAALLFFAYTGYAHLATLGEEVQEPRKTIPRAIILALAIAAVLYAAVAAVAVGNIGAEGMAASRSLIEAAAGGFRWPQASLVVAVGATTAMLGVLLINIGGKQRLIIRFTSFPSFYLGSKAKNPGIY